jgi:hypothetical protein
MSSSGFISSGLTALGTVVGTALALVAGASFHEVSTCTSTNNGVICPANQPSGTAYRIRNDGVFTLSIYPATGGQINALAANVPYLLASNSAVQIVHGGSLQAYTFENNSPAVIPVAASRQLLPCESGSIIAVTSAAVDIVLTLPAPTVVGLKYKVILVATAGTNITQVTSTGANIVGTLVVCSGTAGNNAGLLPANATSINLVATALAGDSMELISTGAKWLINRYSQLQTGFARA